MSKLVDVRRREILKGWSMGCYHAKPAEVILDSKQALQRWVVDYIGPDTSLTYLEFGVAHGDSLRFFSSSFKHPASSFVGFDSFEGLPESWLNFPKFFFTRNGIAPNFDDARVSLKKGWFQNVVPPFMAQWQQPDGTILIHFDADLYSSTLFVLTRLWPVISHYYFMMDDFSVDDSVALFDFASAYPVNIEFLAQAGQDGNGKAVPLRVFGRIFDRTYDPHETPPGSSPEGE